MKLDVGLQDTGGDEIVLPCKCHGTLCANALSREMVASFPPCASVNLSYDRTYTDGWQINTNTQTLLGGYVMTDDTSKTMREKY